MKKVLSYILIIVSILLIPVLLYISIKEKDLSEFVKTWLYIIIGYVSLICFYIALFILRKRKDK